MDFDFDSWNKLATEDPAEFERRRDRALRDSIAAAPSEYRQRLRDLQSTIDNQRQRAETPLHSCMAMSVLMWSGFFRLRRELNDAARGVMDRPAPERSAEIISLQSYRHARRARRFSGK